MKHILLQKALKYRKRNKIESPKGYTFDNLLGAWVNNVDKSLLILSANFPARGTKKEDIETGEDHKGE
jgi:hypothetical protein